MYKAICNPSPPYPVADQEEFPLPAPDFKYPMKKIIWSQWDQIISFSLEILAKCDKISNANPHSFIDMNPLSRNTGSAPGQHQKSMVKVVRNSFMDGRNSGNPYSYDLIKQCGW